VKEYRNHGGLFDLLVERGMDISDLEGTLRELRRVGYKPSPRL
jgi:hypothetical protein